MRSARRLSAVGLFLLPALAPAELPTAERLDILERRVDRVTDLTLQLDELRAENRKLRGQLENLSFEVEELKRKQRDIYLDIDQRLNAGRQGPASPPAQPPVAAVAPPSSAPPTQAPGAPASADRTRIEAEYEAAYDLLSPQQKRYDEAAEALKAFLARYPGDELAPNAQYWLGEAYYVSQRNAEALAAFEAVVANHPGNPKAPGALFKIGRLQQAAGRTDAARSSYEKVLQDYPDSPAAGLARQRLDQLGR